MNIRETTRSSHPANIGPTDSTQKWLAISFLVAAAVVFTLVILTQLAMHNALPTSLIKIQALDVLGYSGTLALLVNGVALLSIGTFFGICHLEQDKMCMLKIQKRMQKVLGCELSEKVFQKVWDHALSSHAIQWTSSTDNALLERIEAALRKSLIYSGAGFKIDYETETESGKILSYLLRGGPFPTLNFKVWAVLFKKDPVFFAQLLKELKEILLNLAEHPPQDPAEELLYEACIGNLIGLIFFTYPHKGDKFIFPTKVEGHWQACEYIVDSKILLTPSWFSSPISAYGFTSKDGGPPILLFMGSAYPAGEGAIATYLADFTPGLSVGHAPYLLGKEKITEWLKDKEDVDLIGISLGGAMCFHALGEHREKIGKAHIYNPTGLYPWDWDKELFDEGPEVLIYSTEGDLVSTLGYFPEGEKVRLYTLISGERTNNFLVAHALIYPSGEHITMLETNVKSENGRGVRHLLTGVHLFLGPLLVTLPLLLFHLVQRIVRFAYECITAPFIWGAQLRPGTFA